MTAIPVFHAFTIEYEGRVNEIITDAGISLPISSKEKIVIPPDDPGIYNIKALWDTGASNCAITPRAAKVLKIDPISSTRVCYGDGASDANVYLISLFLPNKVMMPMLKVTECKNDNETWDLIIGMDIIGHSDFSITNVGKTVMTFRHPSIKKIDYAKEATDLKASQFKGTGRNNPCPCGSGKKYKYCHGKLAG
ncbi:MAG: SEC-C metal-binding domain-containing protein [Bacteroidales bacterium]|jgi:hypothetical protein